MEKHHAQTVFSGPNLKLASATLSSCRKRSRVFAKNGHYCYSALHLRMPVLSSDCEPCLGAARPQPARELPDRSWQVLHCLVAGNEAGCLLKNGHYCYSALHLRMLVLSSDCEPCLGAARPQPARELPDRSLPGSCQTAACQTASSLHYG